MKLLRTLENNIGKRVALLQTIGYSNINYFGILTSVSDKGWRMKTNTGYTRMIEVGFRFNEGTIHHKRFEIEVGGKSFDLLKKFGGGSKLRVA